MGRRQWIVGIGLGVLGLFAVAYIAMSVLLPRPEPVVEALGEPTPIPTAQIVYVLIAARDVRRGQQIQASDVAIMGWPITDEVAPPLGALLADAPDDEDALEQVIGRLARTDIIKNQPMLDFMLTPGDSPVSLSP